MTEAYGNVNSIDSLYPRTETLGRGGGGIVYKSYDESRRQFVVVKEVLGDSIGLENARREIDLLKNVKSTYLPQVYSFIQIHNQAYTIMEYVEGDSLGELLARGKGMLDSGFSQDECIMLFKELAEALRILHSADPPICHRDIKPDNVMLTQKRRNPDGSAIRDVCLIDFNVSSVVDGHEETLIGYTPPYASPEQVVEASYLKEKWQAEDGGLDMSTPPTVDMRSDIYSLGATMYHAITGVPPKGPLDGIQTDVNEVCGGRLHAPLARIIMKCMANRPEDRFGSAEELLKALDNIYRDTEEFGRLHRRHAVVRISLIVTALVGVFMIFAGMLRIGQEKDAAYLSAVEEAVMYRQLGDARGVDEALDTAIGIYQSRPEAYVQKAEFIYDQGEYATALEYLNEIALPYVKNDPGKGNLYLIAARCYMQSEEKEKAIEAIEEALLLWPDNPEIIEEKAVIMAYSGNASEAAKLLEDAEKRGLVGESAEFTKGEIAFYEGDTVRAYEAYEIAAESTDDVYLKYRAYSQMLKILSDEPLSAESVDGRIMVSDRALKELSSTSYTEQIYQYRFGALMDKAEYTGDTEDASRAVEEMYEYVKDGNGQFDTWLSMVRICREYEMYDRGRSLLDELRDRYGEDYRIYEEAAYMEFAIQGSRDNSERDYSSFADTYMRAKEIYESLSGDGKTDPGMDNLSGIYRDLCDAGWLEEK